jgi:hypothetical protein
MYLSLIWKFPELQVFMKKLFFLTKKSVCGGLADFVIDEKVVEFDFIHNFSPKHNFSH